MSYALEFFGKSENTDEKGSVKIKLLSKKDWIKLKGENTVIVGLDLGDGDVQLGMMVGRPEKSIADAEFSFGNYTTSLLKDSYYFPMKLLLKLDLNQSSGKPNCYLPVDKDIVYNVPLHCIIPPYLEEGQVRSIRSGRESMNFTNYINYEYHTITTSRGNMNCIVVGSAELRYLKSYIT